MALLFYGLGLFFLLVGERVFGAGHDLRLAASGLAALLVLTAFVTRLRGWAREEGGRRDVVTRMLLPWVVAIAGLLLYAAVADGSPLELDGDKATVLRVLWPIVWLAGTAPVVFMETTLASMAGARALDGRRLADSGRSGLILALALSWLMALNFAANQRDDRIDLRTVRDVTPSQATLEMVRNLHDPVTVSVFFPPGNDVLEVIQPYWKLLDDASESLTVEVLDRDERPARAKELRARNNGTIVFSQGDSKESLSLDVDAEKARKKLKKLDQDVQQKLAKVHGKPRTAYFVSGHGERATSPSTGDPPGLKDVKDALQVLNFKVKKLGLNEGLADKVPDDATVVFLIGPKKAMLGNEQDALMRYVQGGGSLILAADPDVDEDPGLDPLLAVLGLKIDRTVLVHDSKYVPLDRGRTDRSVLFTNRFTTHDSTTILGKLGSQVAVVFPTSGSLTRDEAAKAAKDGGPDVQVTIRSLAGTWQDGNGDLDFQKDSEKKDVFQLAAAVQLAKAEGAEGHGGRALVVADADVMSDLILSRSPGNQQWLVDGLRWLEDEVQLAGEIAEVEDVPILHTKDEDKAWFYGTTLGIPLLVMGGGVFASRRRRSKSA